MSVETVHFGRIRIYFDFLFVAVSSLYRRRYDIG
jgi:hypothetical protein